MAEPQYISPEDVVNLHDDILFRMGSPYAALLHPDRLESAVARCKNVAYYEGADPVRQAVVLAVAVSQSQAFEDGNKRGAFAAMRVFLRVNGLNFRGQTLGAARRLEAVAEAERGAERDRAVDEFEAWLREQLAEEPYAP